MAADLNAPLVVILGPTASGKTAVALELAAELDGEIVCADSRTVYRGLDIGTAKPTAEERALVPHWLLDVVDPDETYTVARFQRDARAAIADIRRRGKVPFLVGGSGLYLDSIIFDYQFAGEPDYARRAELEAMTLDELFRYSNEHNVKLPNNSYNKRYVIRAIEQGGINTGRRITPVDNTIIVGITTDRDVLHLRITRRAEMIFHNGVVDEARKTAERYGWDITPLQAPAYKPCRDLLEHTIDESEAIARLARDDWQLARKQSTWFRRNGFIHWLPLEEIAGYVRSQFVH